MLVAVPDHLDTCQERSGLWLLLPMVAQLTSRLIRVRGANVGNVIDKININFQCACQSWLLQNGTGNCVMRSEGFGRDQKDLQEDGIVLSTQTTLIIRPMRPAMLVL